MKGGKKLGRSGERKQKGWEKRKTFVTSPLPLLLICCICLRFCSLLFAFMETPVAQTTVYKLICIHFGCNYISMRGDRSMSLISLNIHRAAEEDVDAQRQELMAGFDDAQRKREHEFRRKADDLSNSLLASELKVRVVVFVLHGQSFLATHDILCVPFFRHGLYLGLY